MASTKQVVDQRSFCAIVFIGGGSSWWWGSDPDDAAQRAAKLAKSDWGRLFKFGKKQPLKVAVFDMKDHSGWYANSPDNVRSKDTNERLVPLKVVEVIV